MCAQVGCAEIREAEPPPPPPGFETRSFTAPARTARPLGGGGGGGGGMASEYDEGEGDGGGGGGGADPRERFNQRRGGGPKKPPVSGHR